jgi:hypothetical protein
MCIAVTVVLATQCSAASATKAARGTMSRLCTAIDLVLSTHEPLQSVAEAAPHMLLYILE